jgi:hypothetical protein
LLSWSRDAVRLFVTNDHLAASEWVLVPNSMEKLSYHIGRPSVSIVPSGTSLVVYATIGFPYSTTIYAFDFGRHILLNHDTFEKKIRG